MGTETTIQYLIENHKNIIVVKLNDPLMGTETNNRVSIFCSSSDKALN